MTIITVSLYLLVGVAAGILAGLLGVGGGIIVVPALTLLFSNGLFSSDLVMHMAVGTSLAIMIFTAISSGYAYHRRGLVIWPLFLKFTPGLLLGTITGAIIAKHLSGRDLTIAFALFLIIIAIRMFFSKTVKAESQLPNLFILTAVSFCVGILSGFFGVGGGIVMVPFFSYCNVPIHKATGTSSACGFPLAIVGTLLLIITGWTMVIANHPPVGTTGFVYWPAAILIAITSILFAPVGTRLAVWLPGLLLKRVFAIVLVLTAIELFIS